MRGPGAPGAAEAGRGGGAMGAPGRTCEGGRGMGGAAEGNGCRGPDRIWPGRVGALGMGRAGGGVGRPGLAETGGGSGTATGRVSGALGAAAASLDFTSGAFASVGLASACLASAAGASATFGSAGLTSEGLTSTGLTAGRGSACFASRDTGRGSNGGRTGGASPPGARLPRGGCIGMARPISGGRRGRARGLNSSLSSSFAVSPAADLPASAGAPDSTGVERPAAIATSRTAGRSDAAAPDSLGELCSVVTGRGRISKDLSPA